MPDVDLSWEIAVYEQALPKLRAQYGSTWVVVAGQAVKAGFGLFEQAAEYALATFSDRPFLIRNTDERPAQFPFVFVEA